jgi:hypothetical protein
MAPLATPWIVIVGDLLTAAGLVDARSAGVPLCDDTALVLPTPPRCPSSRNNTTSTASLGALDEIRLRCGAQHPSPTSTR